MKEIWKDIEGYEELYQVSNFGNVRNKQGLIMKQRLDTKGYKQINLIKNGVKKTHRVHRLVAQAYLVNVNNYPCINHKDENKQNNCVDNLEFCTVKYNLNYGTTIERARKSRMKPIKQYSLDGELIKVWNCAKDIEREKGYSHSCICNCLKGKTKQSYNFIWRYV